MLHVDCELVMSKPRDHGGSKHRGWSGVILLPPCWALATRGAHPVLVPKQAHGPGYHRQLHVDAASCEHVIVKLDFMSDADMSSLVGFIT